MSEEGTLQNYSVDQLAGAVVLVLGAVAGLLQVIWMSKCHCKVNLCYFFRCERRPPSEEEMKSLKDAVQEKKDKDREVAKDKKDKEDKEKEESIIPKTASSAAPPRDVKPKKAI